MVRSEKVLTFWWHVYAKTMTGKLLNVATALSGCTTLKGPLSCIVSPLMKCATTSMTKYPIEISAIMLVYFRESKRLKNDKGITINLGSMVSLLEHSLLGTGICSHESCHPEMSVDEETYSSSIFTEPSDNAGHQVSDNDQIADPHPKAFDSDSGIKDHSCIRICDLR